LARDLFDGRRGAAMRELNEADARALLELLILAMERREPAVLLEAGERAWRRGPLARAAGRCAAAVGRGEPLSSALEDSLPAQALAALTAGETCGDPAAGLMRATAALGRSARGRQRVLAPAAYPLAVLSFTGIAGSLLTLLAAPSIQALRVELAALAGRPEPGGAVAFAAAHPLLVMTLGVMLAVAPLLLPLVFAWLPRTRAGCALMLRLPLVGHAVRLRARADLLESLGDLIAGGVAHDRAWELASAAVGPRIPRQRLLGLASTAAAGEPLDELLQAAGLSVSATPSLKPELMRQDGGIAAMRECALEADEAHERVVSFAGRGFALVAGIAGVAAAAGLIAAVLLPLFQAGGA